MQPDWTVSTARWWHMPGITRLIRQSRRRRPDGVPVAREALLWTPFWSPSVGLVQSVWGSQVPGVPAASSHVVEARGRVVGLGQSRSRGDARQWEVTFLAIEPGEAVGATAGFPDRRAMHLLGRLCDAATERGAERIFALVRDDGAGHAILRQLSFALVTRELAFLLPASVAPSDDALAAVASLEGVRRQERADAFGVYQLYRVTTPPVVQLAEARRPQSWDLPRRAFGALPRLARVAHGRRWVVTRDDQIVAWAHLAIARRGPHQLSLMVAPSAADLAVPLVTLALDAARRARVAPVVASIRDHQWPEHEALTDSGFRPHETNLIMMKQLALAVPSARRHLLPAMERVVS